jgi:hypothetical protein
MTVVMNVLSKLGLQALGVAMPRIAWSPWEPLTINPVSEPAGAPPLTLRALESGNPAPWIAPLAGTLREVDTSQGDKALGVPLVRADGSAEQGKGVLLTLHAQLFVRLARLYTDLLEQPVPAPSRGIPVRPVPKYFFYSVPDMTPNKSLKLNGGVNPGDALGRYQDLRVYDADGQPIDPLAVLSALNIFLAYHPSLTWLPSLLATPPLQNMVGSVAQTLSGAAQVRLRLCDADGKAYGGANLGGVGAVNAATGLCFLNNGLAGGVTRNAGASATLLLGSPQRGTLGAAFNPPALSNLTAGIIGAAARPAMFRDFFNVCVLDLQPFLLGTPDPSFTSVQAGSRLETPPPVRTQQSLTLLSDGNDVLAAAQAVLSTAGANQYQCVAQAIDGDFNLPAALGPANSRWPQSIATGGVGPAVLAPNLFQPAQGQVQYITVGGVASGDVLLTLTGLIANTAVRVFPRAFTEDARELRGDGAGAVLMNGQTTAQFVLRDPFGLVGLDGTMKSVAPQATLSFDLAVVSNQVNPATGLPVARIYGNRNLVANAASTIANVVLPAVPGDNAFDDANIMKGACSAQVLGLTPPGAAGVLAMLNGLTGVEPGNPGAAGVPGREPPRLPTQACRDLVVSNRASAVLSGGRLTPELMSAQTTLGAPGSPGGREVQAAGVFVQAGQLAHDLAVLALRRTEYLPLGLFALFGPNWDPLTPAPATGTFAAAVLQNTAPMTEMPALYFLKNDMPAYATAKAGWTTPANNFDSLVNWIDSTLNGKSVTVAGQTLNDIAKPTRDALKATLTNVNNAITGPPVIPAATANLRKQRLFQELDQRVVTAVYGRRDTEWALKAALGRARKLIYLETPGLASTRLNPNSQVPAVDDLLNILLARMTAVPSLRVVLCMPKLSDFPPRFQDFADYELKDRAVRLMALPQDRLRVLHPVGFPGRPSRLATTVALVDDTWMLVGSSTLRRRGLSFDGSSDLVLTDTVYENGACVALARYRRTLMAQRLGIPPTDNGLPHPAFVQLLDGASAFDVVSEVLEVGGAGRVEPLWKSLDAAPITDALLRQANPDGKDVVEDSAVWAELFVREYAS